MHQPQTHAEGLNVTQPFREHDEHGDELISLANAYCDGPLTPSETQRLEQLLRGSHAAQQRFLLLLDVHARLLTDARGGCPAVPDPVLPVEHRNGSSLANGSTVNGSAPAFRRINGHTKGVAARGAVSASPVVAQPARRQRLRRFLAGAAAVCVTIGALVQIGITILPRGGRGEILNAPGTAAVQPLARVSRTVEIDGKLESPLQAGQVLNPGILQISKGRLELALGPEVLLLVQAPSQIQIEEGGHVRLIAGRLAARVSNPKLGFVVNVQSIKITDLGTEFGVAIGTEGEVHVQVFEGAVLVEADGDSGLSLIPQRLAAGQAYTVNAGGTAKMTKFDSDLFVRDFSPAELVNQLCCSPAGACAAGQGVPQPPSTPPAGKP